MAEVHISDIKFLYGRLKQINGEIQENNFSNRGIRYSKELLGYIDHRDNTGNGSHGGINATSYVVDELLEDHNFEDRDFSEYALKFYDMGIKDLELGKDTVPAKEISRLIKEMRDKTEEIIEEKREERNKLNEPREDGPAF